MDIQTSLALMGMFTGMWAVTAWFVYRRVSALKRGDGAGHDPQGPGGPAPRLGGPAD